MFILNSQAASLKAYRLLIETYVLISEELLMASKDDDLVHSQTGAIIVKADGISNLVQTCYDQAKEKLQEIGKPERQFRELAH